MRSALLILLLLVPVAACAHGLFWADDDGEGVLMTGHRAGEEHGDGAPAEPLDATLVTEAWIADGSGWQSIAVPSSGPVCPAAADMVVAVDWGWWVQSAAGTENRSPTEVPDAWRSWRSHDTLRRLVSSGPHVSEPVGSGFEITPVEDPFSLGPGDRITLRVTHDDRPVADVPVLYGDRPRGRTDSHGCIRLKVRHGGRQVFSATLRTPLAESAHAEEVRSAALVFVLEGS